MYSFFGAFLNNNGYNFVQRELNSMEGTVPASICCKEYVLELLIVVL